MRKIVLIKEKEVSNIAISIYVLSRQMKRWKGLLFKLSIVGFITAALLTG